MKRTIISRDCPACDGVCYLGPFSGNWICGHCPYEEEPILNIRYLQPYLVRVAQARTRIKAIKNRLGRTP